MTEKEKEKLTEVKTKELEGIYELKWQDWSRKYNFTKNKMQLMRQCEQIVEVIYLEVEKEYVTIPPTQE